MSSAQRSSARISVGSGPGGHDPLASGIIADDSPDREKLDRALEAEVAAKYESRLKHAHGAGRVWLRLRIWFETTCRLGERLFWRVADER